MNNLLSGGHLWYGTEFKYIEIAPSIVRHRNTATRAVFNLTACKQQNQVLGQTLILSTLVLLHQCWSMQIHGSLWLMTYFLHDFPASLFGLQGMLIWMWQHHICWLLVRLISMQTYLKAHLLFVGHLGRSWQGYLDIMKWVHTVTTLDHSLLQSVLTFDCMHGMLHGIINDARFCHERDCNIHLTNSFGCWGCCWICFVLDELFLLISCS